jgi:hypothetical protein
MKPEEVVLTGTYDKETEEYLRTKLAEYYTMYPENKESHSQNYRSNIPNYEERCKKIRDNYIENCRKV